MIITFTSETQAFNTLPRQDALALRIAHLLTGSSSIRIVSPPPTANTPDTQVWVLGKNENFQLHFFASKRNKFAISNTKTPERLVAFAGWLSVRLGVSVDDQTIYRVAGNLYNNYCEGVGGVAFNGDALPTWREFSKDPHKRKQSNAWLSVARVSLGTKN